MQCPESNTLPVPAYIFLSEWVKLDMSDTKSCGRFAIWGIKAKLFTGCAFLASLGIKALFA
jgi:hypothetical protein